MANQNQNVAGASKPRVSLTLPELLPCHHCGGNDITIIPREGNPVLQLRDYVAITCVPCCASCFGKTKRTAIVEWNTIQTILATKNKDKPIRTRRTEAFEVVRTAEVREKKDGGLPDTL